MLDVGCIFLWGCGRSLFVDVVHGFELQISPADLVRGFYTGHQFKTMGYVFYVLAEASILVTIELCVMCCRAIPRRLSFVTCAAGR